METAAEVADDSSQLLQKRNATPPIVPLASEENLDILSNNSVAVNITWGACFCQWIKIVVPCIANGWVWSSLHSYSVIYAEIHEKFKSIEIHLSWIGSITYGGTLFCALLAPYLYGKIGMRWAYAAGVVISASGFLLTSFIENPLFWYISWSVMLSVGFAIAFTSGFVYVAINYKKNPGIAFAIIGSGGVSLLTMTIPLMWQALINIIGLRHTLWTAAAATVCQLLFTSLMPTKEEYLAHIGVKQESVKNLIYGSAFSLNATEQNEQLSFKGILRTYFSRNIIFWTIGSSLQLMMTITPYVHLVSLVIRRFPSLSYPAICLTVMSIGSCISKIIFGILAERTSLTFVHLNQISWAIYGLGLTLVPLIFNTNLFLALCFVLGLGEGPVWTLSYPTFYELSPVCDPQLYGVFVSISAVPYIMGGPISAWIHLATNSYNMAFYSAGTVIITGSLVLFMIKHRT